MDEAQGAHADQDKQQGLGQFEGRNKQQPPVVVGLADGDSGCGVDKFLLPCGARLPMGAIDTLNDRGWFSPIVVMRPSPSDRQVPRTRCSSPQNKDPLVTILTCRVAAGKVSSKGMNQDGQEGWPQG
jgi:hypothetical protein